MMMPKYATKAYSDRSESEEFRDSARDCSAQPSKWAGISTRMGKRSGETVTRVYRKSGACRVGLLSRMLQLFLVLGRGFAMQRLENGGGDL